MTTLGEKVGRESERVERRSRLVDEIREQHVAKGHTWSSRAGYCSESNGITAVWCDIGVLLEGLQSVTDVAGEMAMAAEYARQAPTIDRERLARALVRAGGVQFNEGVSVAKIAAEYEALSNG